MSLATPEKIRTLQRKLYVKAKAEPACRFHLLYDKICREDALRHAYRLAKANGGAPGVDGMTFGAIEAAGVEGWLSGLREELCEPRDAALAGATGDDPEARRRRATARHPDDPGSCGADRGEAIARTDFEADLSPRAFGYRPKRSALDAIKIRGTARFARVTPTWWTLICPSNSTAFRTRPWKPRPGGSAHRRPPSVAVDQTVAEDAGRGAGW